MRISTFIIGLLIISAMMAVFISFVTLVGEKSEKESQLSSIDLNTYNRMQNLTTQLEVTKGNISQIKAEKSSFDIVGRMLTGGWQALKTTMASLELSMDIADDAFVGVNETGGLPLGAHSATFRNLLMGILIVVIFIVVLLGIVLKWNT